MTAWTSCNGVEHHPERVSGSLVFAGTRVTVATLFDNPFAWDFRTGLAAAGSLHRSGHGGSGALRRHSCRHSEPRRSARPLTTGEAVLSSRIGGTRATMGLDWIFERPIFRSTDFVTTADIPEPTARRILNLLIEGGILKVLWSGRGRRPGVFCFSDLLDIAEGRRTP